MLSRSQGLRIFPQDDMDWDDLRYFAELARTGSLSAAARALKVDHTTVARRVSSLEQSLGVRLFDRLPRGWALTADGEQAADRVRLLEEVVFALSSFARGRSHALGGTVRVSAPPTFGALFMMPRLGLLRERHPGIELDFIGESRIANLTRREADLALRIGRPEGASMVARRLPDFAYGLFGRRDYVASVPPAEWTLLGHDESLEHSPHQQWMRRYAAGRPLVIRSNDIGGLLNAVRAGIGVAVLASYMAALAPDLVCLEQGDEMLRRELWLVVHADVRRSPSVRAVMDTLIEIIDRDRTLIEGPV
jgi:DNA-binding transcriptional LysR family regulator